jgi:hypothetical protein
MTQYNLSTAMALSTSQTTRIAAMDIPAIPAIPAKPKEIVRQDVATSDAALSEAWRQFTTTDATASDHVANEAWKRFYKTIPFLCVPPEIHLKIFTFLNPIDAVCLSLVKYVSSLPMTHQLLTCQATICTPSLRVLHLSPIHFQLGTRAPPSQLSRSKAASTASQSGFTLITASFITIYGVSYPRSLISVAASAESTRCVSRKVSAIAMSIVELVGLVIGDAMKGEDACWIC